MEGKIIIEGKPKEKEFINIGNYVRCEERFREEEEMLLKAQLVDAAIELGAGAVIVKDAGNGNITVGIKMCIAVPKKEE